MIAETEFIAAVQAALEEHGQAVRQYVTATLDGSPTAPADIVFAPDDPHGRVVCVEVRITASPTVANMTLASILRHRKVIEAANPGAVYVLLTNAKLSAGASDLAEREKLIVLTADLSNAVGAAFEIKALSIGKSRN